MVNIILSKLLKLQINWVCFHIVPTSNERDHIVTGEYMYKGDRNYAVSVNLKRQVAGELHSATWVVSQIFCCAKRCTK